MMYLELFATLSALAGPQGSVAPAVAPVAAQAQALSPAANSAGETEISVLTYNIHGLPWPLASGRAHALKSIGRELAAMRREGHQPDIVLIQEGFRGEVADLVKASGYGYWAQGPGRLDRDREAAPADAKGFRVAHHRYRGEGLGKFLGGGLHVLSDAPISDVKDVSYRYCAGFDCLANKGVMMARIAVAGVPGGIEVVNTHMNSRTASGASQSRSTRAHNLQAEEMLEFLGRHHEAQAPLVVGGDFNVKGAPTRYAAVAGGHTFSVVSEFCDAPGANCAGQAAGAKVKPWTVSQDLQAFSSGGEVQVRPVAVRVLFPEENGSGLSDHDGYLVRYRLSWSPHAAPGQPARQTAALDRTATAAGTDN